MFAQLLIESEETLIVHIVLKLKLIKYTFQFNLNRYPRHILFSLIVTLKLHNC